MDIGMGHWRNALEDFERELWNGAPMYSQSPLCGLFSVEKNRAWVNGGMPPMLAVAALMLERCT